MINLFKCTARRAAALALRVFILPVMLIGCTTMGATSPSAGLDMALEKAETSPIPGATAKVFAPPPGSSYSGPSVGFCVTEAGYCPLAAQTEPGQNCLCQAGGLMYGGTTNAAPKLIDTDP